MKEEAVRIQQKYKELGISALDDREILVLLLLHTESAEKAVADADKLLTTFGTLCAVLEKSPRLLTDTKTVGVQAAVLLNLIPTLSRACGIEKSESARLTDENYIDILRSLFIGYTTEHFYMLSLKGDNSIIETDCLSKGTINRAAIYTRHAISIALNNGTKKVILAHNHPNGSPMPSDDDIRVTLELYDALKMINVELIDHVVISDNAFVSMSKDMHLFENYVPSHIRTKFTTTYRPT